MNFNISKIQKGVVLSSLPDMTGKLRPMALLTDLSQIDCTGYGKDCLMLPLYTDASSEFSIPIMTECRDGLRRGFVSPIAIMPVPYNSIMDTKIYSIGVLPQFIIDIAIGIYTAYLTSNANELERYKDEVFHLTVEYMNLHNISFMEHPHRYGIYRKVNANGTVELYEKYKDPRNVERPAYVAIRERKTPYTIMHREKVSASADSNGILWDSDRRVDAQTTEALLQFEKIYMSSPTEVVMDLYGITKKERLIYRKKSAQNELSKRTKQNVALAPTK